MGADPRYPNFDPDFCNTVTRIAAVANAAILVVTLVLLSTISPDPARCPGWRLPDAQSTSAWLVVAIFVGFPALWICFLALRPDCFARKVIESLENAERRASSSPLFGRMSGFHQLPMHTFPLNWLLVVTMIGWTLFCCVPPLLILGECTQWLRP